MNTTRNLWFLGLCLLWTLAGDASAQSFGKGDVNGDGKFDAGDVELLTRIVAGEVAPTDAQRLQGDVGPLNKRRSAVHMLTQADVLIATRALNEQDLDGDGILNATEFSSGTNPFSNDSDDDGIRDDVELAGHSNPLVADTDGDGFDDGDGNGVIGTPCTGGVTTQCDDNCPNTYNPTQADHNSDQVGDACQCGDLSGDGYVTIGDVTQYSNYLQSYPNGGPIGSTGAPARCDVNGDDMCDAADQLLLQNKVQAGTQADLKSVTSCSDPRRVPLASNSTPYPDQIPTNFLNDVQSFVPKPPAWSETLVNTVDYFYANPVAARDPDTSWLLTKPSLLGMEPQTPIWALIDSSDRSYPMNTHDWLEQRGIFVDGGYAQEYNETFGFKPPGARKYLGGDAMTGHGIVHDVEGHCVVDAAFNPDEATETPVQDNCDLVNPNQETSYTISNLSPRWSAMMELEWQKSPLIANAISQDNLGAGPVGGTGIRAQGRWDAYEIRQFVKYLEQTGRQHDFWVSYHALPGNQPLIQYLHDHQSVAHIAGATTLYDDVRLSASKTIDWSIRNQIANLLTIDPVLREYHLFRHVAHLGKFLSYYKRVKATHDLHGRSGDFGWSAHGNGAPGSAYSTVLGEVADCVWGEGGNAALNEIIGRQTISAWGPLRFMLGEALGRGRPVLFINQWFSWFEAPNIDVGFIDFDWAEQSANGSTMFASAGYIEYLNRPELRTRLAQYLAFRDQNRALYEQKARTNPAEVALVFSVPTILHGGWNDSTVQPRNDLSGAARALQHAHISYEVIVLDHPDLAHDTLTLDQLRKYKVLITASAIDLSNKHACLLYDYIAGRNYVAGSETGDCLNPQSGSQVVPNGNLVVIGELGRYDETHTARGTDTWTTLSGAFPAFVKRPLNTPPADPVTPVRDFEWFGASIFYPPFVNDLDKVTNLVKSMIPNPLLKVEPTGAPQIPDPYRMLWTNVFVHALDPSVPGPTKDLLSVHFLRYDMNPTRVNPADPSSAPIASIAPTYTAINGTKVTVKLPSGFVTTGGLEAWWLSPGFSASPITSFMTCSPTGAPTSCVVTLPMAGTRADLDSYKVLVIGATDALAKSNALRRGDRYLLRARYAGSRLNSPPDYDSIATQRSVANAATYLTAARNALLNAGDGRAVEQSDRETAWKTRPLDSTRAYAFAYSSFNQSQGWQYVDPSTSFNPVSGFGWLPSSDASTETPGEAYNGGDTQLANFDTLRIGATAWQIADPDPSIFGQLSGKSRTFRTVLPSAGTYQFEILLTSETNEEVVSGMIRLNDKPVSLDTAAQLGGLARVVFKATVPATVNLTFGGAANFGVAYLAIRQTATADPPDTLDSYGLRDWKVSPRRPNPEWWPLANSPCSDDVYDLTNPNLTNWVKPNVSAAGIPIVDLGPPQFAQIGDVAYAATEITREAPSTEYLSIGASSGAVACLNGAKVMDVPNSRGVMRDEVKVPVSLAAGKNVLVLKLERFWERRWMFYASLVPQ